MAYSYLKDAFVGFFCQVQKISFRSIQLRNPIMAVANATSLDDFELGVTLGTGSFGRVRLATRSADGTMWAIKMLKKGEVIRLQQVEHMISEKTILMEIDHPFIVNCTAAFQDPAYLYLSLEFVVGGEFFTHLRKAGRLDNNASKFYSAQITTIFEYLHSKDIIYRDLKPENLLLDQTVSATVLFALARYIRLGIGDQTLFLLISLFPFEINK